MTPSSALTAGLPRTPPQTAGNFKIDPTSIRTCLPDEKPGRAGAALTDASSGRHGRLARRRAGLPRGDGHRGAAHVSGLFTATHAYRVLLPPRSHILHSMAALQSKNPICLLPAYSHLIGPPATFWCRFRVHRFVVKFIFQVCGFWRKIRPGHQCVTSVWTWSFSAFCTPKFLLGIQRGCGGWGIGVSGGCSGGAWGVLGGYLWGI